jgi:arsenical pump membrane protein
VLFTGTVLLVTSAERPARPGHVLRRQLSVAVVAMRQRRSPLPLLRHVSWGVLPLVAGCSCWWKRWRRPASSRLQASALQAWRRTSHQASWLAGGALRC